MKKALKVGLLSKRMFTDPIKIRKIKVKKSIKAPACSQTVATACTSAPACSQTVATACTSAPACSQTVATACTSAAIPYITSPMNPTKRKLTFPQNPETKRGIQNYYTKRFKQSMDTAVPAKKSMDMIEAAMAVAHIPLDDDFIS
jgi:hypothetical protein